MIRSLLIAAALWLCACPPPAPAPPPGPLASCARACAAYSTMGCAEGQPTREGHSCEEVCEMARVSSVLPDELIA